MSIITTRHSDRMVVFSLAEREAIRELLKGRVRWDRRTNRWVATGDLEELAGVLKRAGYEVRFIGPG
jgi:hypothetical protein